MAREFMIDPRGNTRHIRFSDAEIRAIQGAADFKRRSQSEFIRRAVEEAVERAREEFRVQARERTAIKRVLDQTPQSERPVITEAERQWLFGEDTQLASNATATKE